MVVRLRIALAQQRLDHLLEQARFAVGGNPPAAQVAGIDAEVEESLGDPGDFERVLVVGFVADGTTTPYDWTCSSCSGVRPDIEQISAASSTTPAGRRIPLVSSTIWIGRVGSFAGAGICADARRDAATRRAIRRR